MDFARMLELAGLLNVPGLVAQGVAFAAEVKAAAERMPHILTDADRTELDAIHADALAAADALDAKLAEAERRG